MLIESVKMSWENIVNNKLRSFLTMLGIVIGVASIIALITIVEGATETMNKQMSGLGANRIIVRANGTMLKRGFDDSDIKKLKTLHNIEGVSPTISSFSKAVSDGKTTDVISIEGKNEVYFKNDESLLKNGRHINILDIESSNFVAVIGKDIVEKLYYGENPLGKTIFINGSTYTIIGTLTDSGAFSFSSNNNKIIIPYTTAMRKMGVRSVESMDVFLQEPTLADSSVTEIKHILNESFNYKENSFSVFNMGDMVETFQTMMSMMSLMLAGIAAISLVVGGIGIMNMMLVSITERTTEIGLRKALGATPGRIQMQFIIEAIFLAFIGGMIGLALGLVIAWAAASMIGIDFIITAGTVTLAVGFSAAVGIIFGYMPARKASKLNPIDALRSL